MLIPDKEILKKITEKFLKKDAGFYLEYISENIKWNIIGKTAIAGKKNFLKKMKSSKSENSPILKIKNIIAEGEYVVIESTGKIKTKTGKTFESAYCDIYKLKDGKIQEMTTYFVNAPVKGK